MNPTNGDNRTAGIALPKDVAQQRAAELTLQQNIRNMLLNVSANVLVQLAANDVARQKIDWHKRRHEESVESHRLRVTQACDQTAGLAVQYAESLLCGVGVIQRSKPAEGEAVAHVVVE